MPAYQVCATIRVKIRCERVRAMNTNMEYVRQAKESFNRILDNQKYVEIIKDDKHLFLLFMKVKKDGHIRFYSSGELEGLFVGNGFRKGTQVITDMKFPFSRWEDYVNTYEQTTEREKALYNITNDSGVIWVNHIEVGNTVFVK